MNFNDFIALIFTAFLYSFFVVVIVQGVLKITGAGGEHRLKIDFKQYD